MRKIVRPSGDNKPDQNERHHAGRGYEPGGTDLVLMRERFKQGETASEDQRKEEQDDLAFYGGKQWPSQVIEARKGQPGNNATGTPPVPARPLISVNLVKEPIRQVLNQEREKDYGLELVPADDWGDQPGTSISHDEIKTREGLVRRIQRQSDAQVARNWAFERAVIAGKGWYLVETKYVSDRSSDLELCITKIFNQFGVVDDPNSTADDGSDADFRFVGQTMTFESYIAQWPYLADGSKNELTTSSTDQWRALGEEAPGWFSTTNAVRYVRVMRYYHVKRTPAKVVNLQNGKAVPEADYDPRSMLAIMVKDKNGKEIPETRYVQQRKVIITTSDGLNLLEETEWVGTTIPVIKVLGEALHPYNEKREEQGMVRSPRSSNQGFNWLLSRGVETVALSPIPPIMLAKGQEEGFEAWFQSLATRALPYVVYHNRDEHNDPIGPPTRAPNNMDLVSPIVGLAQMFQGLVKSTTGIPDVSLGNVDPSIKSYRGIKALLAQAEKGTSNFLDNLQTSIRCEARILNEALPRVYGRPGRLAAMVNSNGDAERVILHQPMIQPEANGNGQPPMPQLAQEGQEGAKTYTLTPDADFNVAIKVGKNYDTRRQEETDVTGELIAASPEAMLPVIGDVYFKNQDWPGAEEMSKRWRAMLAPPIQALLNGGQDPAQMQAQMAQTQQAMQELQQQNQQMSMIIQAKQIEKQADLQKAEMDNANKIELEKLRQEGAFAVASLKAELETARTAMEAAKEERIILDEAGHMGREHTHAHAESARDHAEEAALAQQSHEMILAQQQQKYDLEQRKAEQAHRHDLEQGAQGHQQTLEQADQQAQLEPSEPAPEGGA